MATDGNVSFIKFLANHAAQSLRPMPITSRSRADRWNFTWRGYGMSKSVSWCFYGVPLCKKTYEARCWTLENCFPGVNVMYRFYAAHQGKTNFQCWLWYSCSLLVQLSPETGMQMEGQQSRLVKVVVLLSKKQVKKPTDPYIVCLCKSDVSILSHPHGKENSERLHPGREFRGEIPKNVQEVVLGPSVRALVGCFCCFCNTFALALS